MAKIAQSSEVEQVVREYLERNGYTLSTPRKHGENGPDIKAIKDAFTWFVEIIGFQEVPPVRSREFYEAFFRIISRDRNNPNDILVLALPKRFKNGMRQRMQQYPAAWSKLGKAFPNLNIWYIDIEHSKVEERPWSSPCD
jgi:hypothetical protein